MIVLLDEIFWVGVVNSLISLCSIRESSFETCFFTFLLDDLLADSPTRFLGGLE